MLRGVVLCAALVACRNDSDPGFEIVRVPLSAYATPDASAPPDGGTESGPSESEPIIVCIQPQSDDDDSDCADSYHGRSYDEKATERHRRKDGEEHVCCYRRGRTPRSHEEEE